MPAKLYRYFRFDRAKASKDSRTIPLSFSSEYPVRRYDEDADEEYDEVLSHDPDDVDLSRMKDGAPLLDMHDLRKQIGVVEEASIGDDRKGRAVARFSKSSDLANQIWNDVQDGIRTHVSVGYELTKEISRGKGEDGANVRRYRWMPYEISIVSAPEDPNVGIGRGRDNELGQQPEKKTRAKEHQTKALQDCITAVTAALANSQAMTDQCRTACRVCITACEAALENFTPGAAQVCWEECYEACSSLRSFNDEFSQAACAACAAASEVCYQVWSGAGRSVDETKLSKRNFMRLLLDPNPAAGGGGTGAGATGNVTEIENRTRTAERERSKKIRSTTAQLIKDFPSAAEQFRSMEQKAIDEGTTVEDFNAQALAAIPGVKKQNPITARGLGLNEQEIQQYSLGRAIRSVLQNEGKLDGLEGEVHKAMCQRNIGVRASGFWVPPDVMIQAPRTRGLGRYQRDLNVSTFGQGGAMVATNILTPIIELLRNRMVCERMGVQSMAGLEGNVAIPRQTGAATAYSLPESATLTKSTQALDQVMLTPHRVGAWNDYTKQLLLQSSVDVENFIREDLLKVLAIKWDYLILQGAGANSEPTGIMNTIGISSVQFGATATWAKVLAFETALAVANADVGTMAYITTPAVRAAWKAIAKIGSTFPVFIWESGNWGDDSNDGEVNGYRAVVTNQILNNGVAFGHWADAIGPALWGGYDVVVNPYSRDTDGVVRVTVNTWGDCAARHAASFCWSADAGNQ